MITDPIPAWENIRIRHQRFFTLSKIIRRMHRYDQDIKLGIEKNSIGNGAESYQYSGEKLDILT